MLANNLTAHSFLLDLFILCIILIFLYYKIQTSRYFGDYTSSCELCSNTHLANFPTGSLKNYSDVNSYCTQIVMMRHTRILPPLQVVHRLTFYQILKNRVSTISTQQFKGHLERVVIETIIYSQIYNCLIVFRQSQKCQSFHIKNQSKGIAYILFLQISRVDFNNGYIEMVVNALIEGSNIQ